MFVRSRLSSQPHPSFPILLRFGAAPVQLQTVVVIVLFVLPDLRRIFHFPSLPGSFLMSLFQKAVDFSLSGPLIVLWSMWNLAELGHGLVRVIHNGAMTLFRVAKLTELPRYCSGEDPSVGFYASSGDTDPSIASWLAIPSGSLCCFDDDC